MTSSSLFKRLGLIAAVSVLAACTTADVDRKVSSTTSLRSPASSQAEKLQREIQLHDAEKNDFKIGDLNLKKYSIENREDRLEFKVKLTSLLARKDDRMPKEAEVSLEEAVRLLDLLDNETPAYEDIVRLQETVEAYNSNFISPVPRAIWIGAIPYEGLKMIHHSIMNQRAPEAIDLTVEGSADSSRINPKPSSFWRPGRIESKIDMFAGFGRKAPPKISEECTYVEPKKSYGVHGGFKVDCGASGKWKMKFGNESKTEPFNSRFVWALGYNATPIDYVPAGTRLLYDRRVITEYNSRKDLKFQIKSLLGFTYLTKNLQKPLNPFEDALNGAILRDGSFVPADRLRTKLIKSLPQKKGKDDWEQVGKAVFNEAFEKKVKSLVLKEASLEGPKPKNQEDLGSWSWRSVDHPDRREIRAFGIFTAWVNAFDMRQNNNKVSLVTNADGSTSLSHEVSDLGSGFGRATNILKYRNGIFEDLPWDLVRLRATDGDSDGDSNEDGDPVDDQPWVSPYKFPHYSVIENNPAFNRIQLDDAKWMVRKIASFSEQQIQDCLIGAGFTSAETKLVLEKLLDRRKQMIEVFGLSSEFPDLVARKINRELSFDPQKDSAPKTKNAAGSIAAQRSNQKVVKGHLVP